MANSDSERTVAKAANHFLTGTFISRFSGMVRDLSMAFCFGTSPAIAGFLIAFRLSNLLRRLFGEGALLNGFIPFFEGKRKEDPKKGAEFFRDIFWSLSFILLTVIITLEIILALILYYGDISEGTLQIIYMSMVMLPGLLFICLFGLSMALLECEKNFFIPAVAPVAFNFVWIAAVWIFRNQLPHKAMMGISTSIVIAFFLQWWVTLPDTLKYVRNFLNVREWFKINVFSSELKEMIAPLLLGVVGVAAVQINCAVDILMARFASLEGPAYLSYSHRLQQLPLALFALAISSALMPALSRAFKNDDAVEYRSLLEFGFARTFSLLFPGTIAIFILGGASVNLLYGRGEFSNLSTIHTTYCLWCYGVGLVPTAFVFLLAPAFYARKDFWTPTVASILSVIVNLILSMFLVFVLDFGAMSAAFATSIAAFFNMWYLSKKMHIRIFQPLKETFIKVSIASFLSGLFVLFFAIYLFRDPILGMWVGNLDVQFPRALIDQVNHFIVLTSLFAFAFFTLSYLFKIKHVLDFFSLSRDAN